MTKNYGGRILLYGLIGWATILLGLLVIILIAVGISNSEAGNWGDFVLIILIYFIIVPIVYKATKCF